LRSIYEELKSHDWIYGKTLKYTHQYESRYAWGNLELYLVVETVEKSKEEIKK